MKKKLLYFLAGIVLCFPVAAQRKLIYCGTLIDGVSNTTKSNVTIIVEKNKIVQIVDKFQPAQLFSAAAGIVTKIKYSTPKIIFIV